MTNPKFSKILLIIGGLSLILIAIIAGPRAVSLYYQTSGGQQVEYVLSSMEVIPDLGLTCDPLPSGRPDLIKELESSKTKLSRAARINAGNSQSFYYLGIASCLLGDPVEAKKYYEQYTELRSNNPLGYIGLGFASEKLEDSTGTKNAWEAAGLDVQDFDQVGKEAFEDMRYEDAILWYERALLMDPESANPWLGLGETYDALERPKNELDAYLEAWRIDPELSTKHLVNVYQERGNFIAVEEILEKMLEEYPDSSERVYWYRELGDSYRGHGEYDQAIEVYTKAINEFPNTPNLHLTLGWIYFDQGEDINLAVREFEKVIALDNTIAESYYGLARVRSIENRYEEADKYYKEAIARSPDNRWYHLARGNDARSAGDLELAIEIYQDVLDLYPRFAHGYYQLARAYQLNGMLDEAIDSIELAINYKDPPVDQFYARAGNIYQAAGLSEDANNAYRLALALNPDNKTALKGLNLPDGE